MFIIDKDEVMNGSVLSSFINEFVLNKQTRLKKLKRYYKADNVSIKDKAHSDPARPNYQIAHSFASHISDTHTGYFMGSPIKYVSDDNENAIAKILEINRYNDEHSQNLRLERDASIYGIAYELLYVERDGKIKFKDIDPRNSFVIYSSSIEQEPLYFVRMYTVGSDAGDTWRVELYDDKERIKFKVSGQSLLGGLQPLERALHGFGELPVAVYNNNRDRMGDFERVIPMIDAYDSITSNTLNDLENFADAYLIFKNVDMDEEDMLSMRENRLISYNDSDGNADISWLTKEVMDGGAWEGSQAKIEEQIYTLSATPNFTDESFGTASGISLRYKLLPIEQKAGIKEREFRRGIQRRLKLISNMLGLLGSEYSYLDIDMAFVRTLPVDLLNEMQILATGNGLVSKSTLFGQVSFIEDPADEIQKIEDESDDTLNYDLFNGIDPDEEE